MNWAAIVAALFALGFEIAKHVQLSNEELQKAVEAALDKPSEVKAVMDAYKASLDG